MNTEPTTPDRMVVQLAWEGVLAVIALIVLIAVVVSSSQPAISILLTQAGTVGLAATALAFSLRTGAPNLAIGAISAMTGVITAKLVEEQDWSAVLAIVAGLLLATAFGLVLGLVVGALSVPAWAASLGAGVIASGIVLEAVVNGGLVPFRADLDPPGWIWFVVFVIVSVGGAVLWRVPGVRLALSARRRVGEPGRWAGLRPGLGAVVGLTGSSFLGGLAGVTQLLRIRAASPDTGQFLLAAALAAVLLGGVSLFGRRGGLLGVVLATLIVAGIQNLLLLNDAGSWVVSLVVGSLILLGLGVNRALESLTDLVSGPNTPAALSRLPGSIRERMGATKDEPR